jgi:acetyltransferase
LYAIGASDAVPETIEASLQLSEAALVGLGVATGLAIASVHEKRDEFRRSLQQAAWAVGRQDSHPKLRIGISRMLEQRLTLRDGEKVVIRPLKPEDASLYPDFLSEVRGKDLRLRFFVAMREVRPELIEKLVHYDPERAMAFVAIAESSRRLLGVVRLHDDPNGNGAEFAILVRSHLKGHGLGWLMMKHMIAYAQSKKLRIVHGQILAENTTMLQMCSELDFKIDNDPNERGVKVVTLQLEKLKH